MNRKRSIALAYLFCLCVPAGLLAQGVEATLKGLVADSSGAAVPGARVEVKNTGTNRVTATVTDSAGQYTAPFLQPGNGAVYWPALSVTVSAGQYTAPFLQPGTYTVTVEASGFKKFVREGLILSVGDTVAVDIALE